MVRAALSLTLLLTLLVPAVAPAGEHGASHTRPHYINNPPGFGQHKRIGQYAIKQISQGDPAKAEAYLRKYMQEKGGKDDADAHFLLALAHAHQGDKQQAGRHVERAVELGLSPGRFFAGPDEWFAPLQGVPAYQKLERGGPRIIHGPMVGAVTDTGAKLWVRTVGPQKVFAVYRPAEAPKDAERSRSKTVNTSAEADDTGVIPLDGLKPGTAYRYAVLAESMAESHDKHQQRGTVDPQVVKLSHRFRTHPAEGESAAFRIAFGGGAGYVPKHEHMWETIRSFEPRALLMLGDNVYSDAPKLPAVQRYSYYRRQSRPEWRKLVSFTDVHAIWDDHDFSNNDSWGGPKPRKPAWKPKVWRTFKHNWLNPSYGDGKEHPGVYHRFTIGDVDFFLLDCRYYRTSPRLPADERSMLGRRQKRWLKEGVAASDATFKVLCSSVPWDFRTKGNSPDTWNGYKKERNEIFSFLRDEGVEGVVLMSADRHRSDAWLIDEGAGKPEGMYDLYEFNSSRLTNQHVHGEKAAAIFSYNDTQSFGLVRFDTAADEPRVTYEVRTIAGEKVEELTVRRGQLTLPPGG